MRDLNLDELSQVYGGGGKGRGCSPTPPSCGGSKSRKSKKSKKSKKSRKSRHSKSGRYC